MIEAVKKIDKPEWVTTDIKNLFDVLGGDNVTTLFVGGCVRNYLMEEKVSDIDIATVFSPEEVQAKLNKAGIKTIPTGIEHGTITVVLDSQSVEITTLRRDVTTDGRHAETAWTDNWIEDAARRDFTINTLLMDCDGNIFDPLGSGIAALEHRKIEFVGEPQKRIEEDYLRILRYFRFQALYGQGHYDQEALKACACAADKIQTLSRERITQEFFKILQSSRAAEMLGIMFENNILSELQATEFDQNRLERLVALQSQYNFSIIEDHHIILSRLFCVQGNKPIFFDDFLRFSKAQQHFYVKLELAFNDVFYGDEKTLKKAIFSHGKSLLLQGYLLLLADQDLQKDLATLDIFENWKIPECPITGEALLAEGYKTGPELGQELDRRREEWMDECF